jgi:hypothetical protein
MSDDRDFLFGNAGIGRFAAPREQRVEQRPESNMLRMGLIAGGVAVAVLALLTVWSWVGHHRTGIPVVEADTRPVKEKPADQGGLKVEGANEAILSGSTDSKLNVAAAPEAPALGALRAPPPLTTITTPPPAPGTTQDGVRVSTMNGAPMTPQLNISVPEHAPAKAPPPQTAERKQAIAEMTAPPAAETRTTTPPAPVAAKPAAKLAAASAPAVERAGAVAGPVVQLAALDSEAAAKREWARLNKRFGEHLDGHAPVITPTHHDGKTLWRLRVAGFADIAAARGLCSDLKAAGGQCVVMPKG